jgi:hypothetical protein
MPRGFSLCASLGANVNTFELDDNCYYCTIAALKNTNVKSLITATEIMQLPTAQHHEIATLFRDAGSHAKSYIMKGFCSAEAGPTDWGSPTSIEALMMTVMSAGEYCGLEYRRPNGTQHMIVCQRAAGNFVNPVVCADFQIPPAQRVVQNFPPEDGHNFGFRAWFVDEMEELTALMGSLTI